MIKKQKLHFIGIGGIGMSGLARIYLAKGWCVSGSDVVKNNLTDELSVKGAQIFQGHTSGNVAGDVTLVVKSSCITDENPEVSAARSRGVPVILRSELLRNLLRDERIALGITGTHGKTTTSGLLAHIFESCGKDPTVLVGGEVGIINSNAKPGSSGIVIAEVDESDGYFRNMGTTSAVITNVEREHIDNYGTFDNLVEAYKEFVGRIDLEGKLVFNGEDKLLSEIASGRNVPKLSFGIDGDFDATCKDICFSRSIEFDLVFKGKNFGRIKSPLIGRYNLMNILAAVALSLDEGLPFSEVREAVTTYIGAKRRFELIGRRKGVEVREDYAHHPTELSAVIRAAKEYVHGRVIAVFQPHRYSRTQDLLGEFSRCFYDADILILTDIYSAHESIEGKKITVKDLVGSIDAARFESLAYLKKEDIPYSVGRIARKNDLVLILGAGDIRGISKNVVDAIGES